MARSGQQGARNMLPLKFPTKAALVEALEARRPWARRTDKERLAAHKTREKEYMTAFHAACREATKWTYEEAKERGFTIKPPTRYNDFGDWGERPECPQSREADLDKALAQLAITSQDGFSIVDGDWHFGRIHFLLTHDDDAVVDLC